MKITLIQPHYPHGGEAKRKTYLPGGIMNVGSRLLKVGIEVDFIDLNDERWQEERQKLETSDLIGFTALGPPYIPAIIDLIRQMRMTGLQQPMLIGGEGVSRLHTGHFEGWFDGLGAVQIRDDGDIVKYLRINARQLPDAYATSMVPMLRKLSDDQLWRYFTSEFPLFLSQGCKFNCDFCAASKNRKEKYRDVASLADELNFICAYLQRHGKHDVSMYITNLDAFQSPEKLEECLRKVQEIASFFGIMPHMRCLATSRCTFIVSQADPSLPDRLRSCGLEIVAFGVDGATESTWKRHNKKHNSMSELQTVCGAMEQAGITVELLMVIGFQDDTPKLLWRDLMFCFKEALRGRVIRPYLAKFYTPSGNWPSESPLVQAFLKDSRLLLRLDYTMVGSRQTHPEWKKRWLANLVYLTIIGALAPIGKCPTRPLVPVPCGWGHTIATLINDWMPFDR